MKLTTLIVVVQTYIPEPMCWFYGIIGWGSLFLFHHQWMLLLSSGSGSLITFKLAESEQRNEWQFYSGVTDLSLPIYSCLVGKEDGMWSFYYDWSQDYMKTVLGWHSITMGKLVGNWKSIKEFPGDFHIPEPSCFLLIRILLSCKATELSKHYF